MTERGYSVKDVSERLGVSDNSLYNWLKQHKQATDPDPVITQQQNNSFSELITPLIT
nr:transposase [Arsukibacterium tuosuense]